MTHETQYGHRHCFCKDCIDAHIGCYKGGDHANILYVSRGHYSLVCSLCFQPSTRLTPEKIAVIRNDPEYQELFRDFP